MSDFTIYNAQNAPEGSREILSNVEAGWKFIPNLHGTLAESPIALEGYSKLFELFGKSSLTPAEQQVVYLTANYENECHYCMAGHTGLAKMAHVPEQAIQALRDGEPIANAKLEALRKFTSVMVTKRGWVSEDEISAFTAAGYDKENILEVILGIATKVISNYTNHISSTPLDSFMSGSEWQHPTKRNAAKA